MITTTHPIKGARSRKRKMQIEEASPSVDAVSGKNLKTSPMALARWKTTAYKGNSLIRNLVEVLIEMENATCPLTEENFKPQKANAKKGSISGQMWEVDIGKECISSRRQSIGKQVASDPLERGLTRNTARPWWIALVIAKELQSCLKKLDRGMTRKRRNWATQQSVEVNELELKSQLGRAWEKLLLDYFEEEMRAPSSAKHLLANLFIRTSGRLMFTWK